MQKFITVSKGLSEEYYILLADADGPIARIENTDTYDYDEIIQTGLQISRLDKIEFKR